MGMFLSLSAVVGKTQEQVTESLKKFLERRSGGLEIASIDYQHPNFSVIQQSGNNTTFVYPRGFIEWDDASAHLSEDLQTIVFSCHIHDDNLWMYVLYDNGEVVDRFNPVPDYWDDSISADEINEWKGNAEVIAKYIPGLKPEDIERYMRRWDRKQVNEEKAYPDDYGCFGDCWQLFDFMNKLGLPFPLDEYDKPQGEVFQLWTKDHRLSGAKKNIQSKDVKAAEKPWWKLW
jgi:hypothetical protein